MPWADVPPYTRRVIESTPGWCPVDQLSALFELACSLQHLGGDIVEIGTWCGRSAAALALAARLTPGTVLYCVDLFPEWSDWGANPDGTFSFSVDVDGTRYQGCKGQTVWPDAFADIAGLYAEHGSPRTVFESLVTKLDLSNVVRVVRGNAGRLRSSVPPLTAKLAYIDAEHSHDAVAADILTVEPLVVIGGWLCFDDAFAEYPGVDQAVTELVVSSECYGDFAQLTRKLFVARKYADRAGSFSQETGGTFDPQA